MVFADGRMVERVTDLEAKVEQLEEDKRQLSSEVATLQDTVAELKKVMDAVVERLL